MYILASYLVNKYVFQVQKIHPFYHDQYILVRYMTIYSKYTSIYAGKCRQLLGEQKFSPTFKNANYYHFVRGEKGEDFIEKKGF